MLQSAAGKYTGMIDDPCDTVLALLVLLSEGFYIHPDDKAAIAIEVLIKKVEANVDNTFNCTYKDMEMIADVLNIMMVDKEGSPKNPQKNFGIYATM